MVLVPVELRAVSGLDGFCDSERMQSEGDGDVGERCDVRVVELDPQQGVPGACFGQASVEDLDDLGVRLTNQSATAYVSEVMPVPTPSAPTSGRTVTNCKCLAMPVPGPLFRRQATRGRGRSLSLA